MSEIKDTIKRLIRDVLSESKYQTGQAYRKATLGAVVGGTYTIPVSGKPHLVYVRYADGSWGEVLHKDNVFAISQAIANEDYAEVKNLPVLVATDFVDRNFIKEIDYDDYATYVVDSALNIGQVVRDSDTSINASIIDITHSHDMTFYVSSGVYYDPDYQWWPSGYVQLDKAGDDKRPPVSGQHWWGVVCIDPATGGLVVETSSAQSTRVPLDRGRIDTAAFESSGYIPIGAISAENGQTDGSRSTIVPLNSGHRLPGNGAPGDAGYYLSAADASLSNAHDISALADGILAHTGGTPRAAVQADVDAFLTAPGPIGGTTPNTGTFSDLTVTAEGDPAVDLVNSASTAANRTVSLRFNHSNGLGARITALRNAGDADGMSLTFATEEVGGDVVGRMEIGADGNVTINNNLSAAAATFSDLAVSATSDPVIELTDSSSSASNSSISINFNHDGTPSRGAQIYAYRAPGNSVGMDLSFYTQPLAGSIPIERVRIEADGLVNVYNDLDVDGALTAGGAIQATGNISSDSAVTAGSNIITTGGAFRINMSDTVAKDLQFYSNDSARWIFRVTGADSVGNVGSDLSIIARDNSGGIIGTALSFTRATMDAAFANDVTINGDLSLIGDLTGLTSDVAVNSVNAASGLFDKVNLSPVNVTMSGTTAPYTSGYILIPPTATPGTTTVTDVSGGSDGDFLIIGRQTGTGTITLEHDTGSVGSNLYFPDTTNRVIGNRNLACFFVYISNQWLYIGGI